MGQQSIDWPLRHGVQGHDDLPLHCHRAVIVSVAGTDVSDIVEKVPVSFHGNSCLFGSIFCAAVSAVDEKPMCFSVAMGSGSSA